MEEGFDPYREWLGWEAPGRPPHHYALLGLAPFENDPRRITEAAEQRMSHIRSFQTGRRGQYTAKLLNELSAAKLCLLDPAAKATYDSVLHGWFTAQAVAQQNAQQPPPPPPPLVPPPIEGPPAYEEPQPGFAFDFAPQPQASHAPQPAKSTRSQTAEDEGGIAFGPVLWAIPAVLLIAGLVWAGAWWMRREPAPVVPTEPVEVTPGPEVAPPISELPPAVVIQPEFSGELNFLAGTAQVTSGEVKLETQGAEGVLSNWRRAGDAVEWRFEGAKPGIYRVAVTYSAPEGYGGDLLLEIGSSTKAITLRSSGAGAFHTEEVFLPVRSRNGSLRVSAKRIGGRELMIFSHVRLLPRT